MTTRATHATLPALSPPQWGMLSFLVSEVAFFSTLIAAYVTFLGQDTSGPTPAVLALPLVLGTTAALVASSFTIHLAERALAENRHATFCRWWLMTIALGIVFLSGTAYEWHDLITRHGLTIDRNLFGTTYYTLVGFHALHVTVGVVVMAIVLGLALARQIAPRERGAVELVAWYWHFVDVVWLVVFSVVYL
jgi:cytochrome c oxidase subunit III